MHQVGNADVQMILHDLTQPFHFRLDLNIS
nr:MAG TPA: hypothetical protein [Caudoviricetes sp.]